MRDHPHPRDGFDPRSGRGRGPRVFAPGDLKLLLPALTAERGSRLMNSCRQVLTAMPSRNRVFMSANELNDSNPRCGVNNTT